MLTDELCAHRRRAEKARKELAEAKDRLAGVKDELARSAETETCLRKCVDNLTAGTAAVGAAVQSQRAERRPAAEQLELAAKELKEFNARVQEECRSVANYWIALTAEHERLTAANRDLADEVNKREAHVCALRERIVELQRCCSDADDDSDETPAGPTRPQRLARHSDGEDATTSYSSQLLLLNGDGDDVRPPWFSSPSADTDHDVPPEKPSPPTEMSDDLEIIELLEKYK